MKKNMMLRMVISLSLLLLTPCWLYAETPGEPEISDRAREIQKSIPQTPEKLLLVIKALFANPDVDGHDFYEKHFGIERTNWSKSILSGDLTPQYLDFPKIKLQLVPFHFSEASLDRQDKLYKLELTFYRNPDFLMTPALVQKILGPPKKTSVSSPKSDNSRGRYIVYYDYLLEPYRMVIKFTNGDQLRNDQRAMSGYGAESDAIMYHSSEQIQSEQSRQKFFEIHKEYLPISLEITRPGYKHPIFNRP